VNEKIAQMLRGLGAREVRLKAAKVECNCLLAPWTHPGGRDSRPSMVVLQGRYGDPIYACQGCHERGPLRDLLLFLWSKTGRSTLQFVEWLDGEAEDIPKGVDADIFRRRRRLESLSQKDVDVQALRRRVAEASGDDQPAYDVGALQAAEEVLAMPWAQYEPFTGSVPPYALKRGLAMETCREWSLGHDKRMRRLLFPLLDRRGRLMAISGRRYACQWCGSERSVRENRCRECRRPVPEGELCPKCSEKGAKEEWCAGCKRPMSPKYLHSDGFQRNLFLFGEHRIQDGSKCVYVVEGHMDALMLWQAGYRPAVALLGSHPGGSQVEKLVAYYDRIVVVPDGDAAGEAMAADLTAAVAWRVPVVVRLPKKGCDPGELNYQEMAELLGTPPS
jgi:hypothetical protein